MEACDSEWMFFLVLVFLALMCNCKDMVLTPVPEYEAVAGGEAYLPCNYTLPEDPDLVSLMLWYRDQERVPFYTADFRKGTRDNPKHFTLPEYAERSHFDLARNLPAIRLESVSVEDEGYYRCHVEFRRYRTITRTVKLKILIPPHSLVIVDNRGQRLKGLAGPYDEGAYLSLLCEAEGGDPSPSVTWWRDQSLLDDTNNRASQNFVRNELIVLELRRTDLLVELTCQATNTNLTTPLRQTIQIDLNLKPVFARITTPQRHLRVGEDVKLHCESSGSRPPAKISWSLDNKRIQSGKESIPTNRNITYSSLALTATMEDNGKNVTCRAENVALSHPLIQDKWILNVLFPPQLSLHLGANIHPLSIREGHDVYMECAVRSNPLVGEVTWRFEDRPLDTVSGTIISNRSLVLQKVKKEQRGRYRCLTSNTEGEGESEDLLLEVRYVPMCKPNVRDVWGVARDEVVNITCEVDADPSDVTFRWSLNNSLDSSDLGGFDSVGPVSVLSYAPRTLSDYGVLQCWGRNLVGEQREPCSVRIIPAGPPDPVQNCIVLNQSRTWLQVDCEPGFSNGLQQRFHLEVYNSAVDHLQVNLSSPSVPKFSVHDLPAGTPFVLVVYASNEKGKSNTLAIVGHTSSGMLSDTESSLMSKLSSIIGILLAVLGTFLVVGVVGVAYVQIKRKRPSKCNSSIEEDKSKVDMIFKKSTDDLTETTTACPDVVPPNTAAYGSPDGDSICEMEKSKESLRKKDNYRNCVVALKRSWSFKKGHQEKSDVEVTLTDLGHVISKQMEPPSPTFLGDVTLEENLKKIVIKVESSPEQLKNERAYRTDSA